MNLRTTLVLAVLAAVGAVVWKVGPRLPERLAPRPAPAADAGTLDVFRDKLTPKDIRSIQVFRGKEPTLSLERAGEHSWVMPGGWPTRDSEIKELVGLLGSLRSRFDPIPLTGKAGELKPYGLDPPAFRVVVRAGKTDYELDFGEGTAAESDFYRPTYVRLDGKDEVVRLGPGVLAALGRSRDYYQKRQLFPAERVARKTGRRDKVQRLDARLVEVQFAQKVEKEGEPEGDKKLAKETVRYALQRADKGWRLSAPSVDRLDPDKRDALLEAAADLWAEWFVQTSPDDVAAVLGSLAGAPALAGGARAQVLSREWLLERTGLDKPDDVIGIVHDGGEATLLIGKVAGTKTRQAEPMGPPGVPPPPPVTEEFRFAKLRTKDKAFDQVFVIKADRLKDLLVAPGALRDTKLARFEDKDVRRAEVTHGKEKLTLFRDDKDRWQVETSEGPAGKAMLADEGKVQDLLSNLSGLTAQEKDSDGAVLGASVVGLLAAEQSAAAVAAVQLARDRLGATPSDKGPVATVKLVVTEAGDGDKGEKKTREVLLTVLAQDEAGKKLSVRVDDWPRAHVVEDSVLAVLRRPALAYRGKLFDFAVADVASLVVEQKDGRIAFTQRDGKWRMTAPAALDADATKVGPVAESLRNLEPSEYVSENPTPEEQTTYGLGKDSLAVTVQFKDRMRTLRVGKPREGKKDHYARLDDSPSVFAVGEDLAESLKKDALAYLPLEVWKVDAASVRSVRVEKKGAEPFTLERQGTSWKLGAPLNTAAFDVAVKALVDVLANPHADRYEKLAAGPKEYGLDQPFLRLELTAEGDPAKRTLLVGNAVKDGPDRYARAGDGPAVFVLRGDVVRGLERPALDLIDTQLLSVNLDKVDRISSKRGESGLVLAPKEKAWQVLEAPGAPYAADDNAVDALRATLFNLRAERFAAFGGKADLKQYGLEPPFAAVTLSVKDPNPREHVLEVGGEVEGKPGQRYGRLDNGSGVAVLSADDTRVLARTHLDYVNHQLLAVEPGKVASVRRQKGGEVLELAKQDGEWQIVKPVEQRADDGAVGALVAQLAGLRAASVAEFPLKDVKKYGLDTPSAVVTVQLSEGKPGQHTIALGSEVPGTKGERYCRVDQSQVVGVLPAVLAGRLAAGTLAYRDREVARFGDADRIVFERDRRKATFARAGGTWKMTEPVDAKVDHEQLEEFLNRAARLKADELVADGVEKPDELRQYGLDRPQARWRFQEDGKNVLDLLIGKAEPSGRRFYAKAGKGGLVFLLDLEMGRRALSEFRDRTVWDTPLDAAQVDVLRLTRGGKTLVLRREGDAWKAEGEPKAKPNTETVNDTIAALTGLKLAHYAVDKGGDFKLFGLEPPASVVEAEAAGRTMVLHLGGREGDSKRAYARVPEKDRTDVLVLTEKDTERLTRDLKALEKPLPPKPPAHP